MAGYLVHEVYETLSSMLLDAVETIDAAASPRLSLEAYADYLAVAFLPEVAATLDEDDQRVIEI